jgi:hypothetical protein
VEASLQCVLFFLESFTQGLEIFPFYMENNGFSAIHPNTFSFYQFTKALFSCVSNKVLSKTTENYFPSNQ